MTNDDLKKYLYPGRTSSAGRRIPDYSYIHRELAKPGVTLTLLWSEYCAAAEREQKIPYQYTQFCDHYRDYARKRKQQCGLSANPANSWRQTGQERR